MKSRVVASCFAMVGLGGSFASAHHAVSAVYDITRTVTVEGAVQEFRFVNPHSAMKLVATDGAGKTVIWSVELAGVLNLTRGGWTAQTFQPGERLSVSGFPTHSGSPGLFFRGAKRANGEEVLPPSVEETATIDAQRRQRAQQRQPQN